MMMNTLRTIRCFPNLYPNCKPKQGLLCIVAAIIFVIVLTGCASTPSPDPASAQDSSSSSVPAPDRSSEPASDQGSSAAPDQDSSSSTDQVPTPSALDQTSAPEPDPTPVPTTAPALQPGSEDLDPLTVYVFAVGEALSVFIDHGEQEVLIDGGNDGGKRKDGGTVAEFIGDKIGDGTLEYVVATHSHSDHIGGLDADIYDAFHVAHTIYGDKGTTKQFTAFWDAATQEEDSEVHEDIDEVITLAGGVTLSIFDIIDGDKNTNNNSAISLLDYHGTQILITGDAEDEKSKTVREALTSRLRAESIEDIDVYVVGHHGSETSSSEELLSIIKPTYAIISSVGPNHGSYHNPDISVLNRLETINAKIFATYVSGDIAVALDGNGVSLSPPDSELLTAENFADAA
jgi:beta-lactamase superfamily II metal-dependent hydrolase